MKKNISIGDKISNKVNVYVSTPEKTEKTQTAGAKGGLPGLIVIHEIWGLNEHTRDVADRYAAEGYSVVAPDLLSETGILKKSARQSSPTCVAPTSPRSMPRRQKGAKRCSRFLHKNRRKAPWPS